LQSYNFLQEVWRKKYAGKSKAVFPVDEDVCIMGDVIGGGGETYENFFVKGKAYYPTLTIKDEQGNITETGKVQGYG